MQLSPDELTKVKELALAGYSIPMVAEAIDWDVHDFTMLVHQSGSEAFCAYFGGTNESDQKYLKEVIDSSNIGTPQAQALRYRMLQERNLSNLKNFNAENLIIKQDR